MSSFTEFPEFSDAQIMGIAKKFNGYGIFRTVERYVCGIKPDYTAEVTFQLWFEKMDDYEMFRDHMMVTYGFGKDRAPFEMIYYLIIPGVRIISYVIPASRFASEYYNYSIFRSDLLIMQWDTANAAMYQVLYGEDTVEDLIADLHARRLVLQLPVVNHFKNISRNVVEKEEEEDEDEDAFVVDISPFVPKNNSAWIQALFWIATRSEKFRGKIYARFDKNCQDASQNDKYELPKIGRYDFKDVRPNVVKLVNKICEAYGFETASKDFIEEAVEADPLVVF